jgi:hypothetical protein
MTKKIVLFMFLFLVTRVVVATGVDASLSNGSAYFQLLFIDKNFGAEGADVGVGYYYDEEGDRIFTATALIMSQAEALSSKSRISNFIQYGLGFKGYMASLVDKKTADDDREIEEDKSASALAIGGTFRLIFPTTKPIALAVDLFAAPKITSFGEATNFLEIGVRAELEIRPDARAYVGYRYIRTQLDDYDDDITIDNTPIIGMRLIF